MDLLQITENGDLNLLIDVLNRIFLESVIRGKINIMEYLYDKLSINVDELMIAAIKNRQLNSVKFLTEKGANIHLALIEAVKFNSWPVVKYLVNKGAEVSTNEDLALICAVKNGNLDMVKYLIKHGSNLHRREEIIEIITNNEHILLIEYFNNLFMIERHKSGLIEFQMTNIAPKNIRLPSIRPNEEIKSLPIIRSQELLRVTEENIPRLSSILPPDLPRSNEHLPKIHQSPAVINIKVSTNPEATIIRERQNIICNHINTFEGGFPLDPITVKPIPKNLIVSVVTVYNLRFERVMSSRCYDARSLYKHWQSQTENDQEATDPSTGLKFDQDSVEYVIKLLSNYQESKLEEFYHINPKYY